MLFRVTVEGVARTVKKLDDNEELVKDATRKALLAIALIVQRRAQQKTPVEFGPLRASAFTERAQDGFNVSVGYSALYAKWVHDLTEEKLRGQPRPSGLGTYWNPGESRFLAKALEEVQPLIEPTIQRFIDIAIRIRGGGASQAK